MRERSETPQKPTPRGLLADVKWPQCLHVRVRLVDGERQYEFTEVPPNNVATGRG